MRAGRMRKLMAQGRHRTAAGGPRPRTDCTTKREERQMGILGRSIALASLLAALPASGAAATEQGEEGFSYQGPPYTALQRTRSGGVKLRVRDTGIGMSQGEIAVAMQPFQQLDTSPRKQTGTGLGLPLTKALAEANKAKFKLRSIADTGTRIDVTFPAGRVAHVKD